VSEKAGDYSSKAAAILAVAIVTAGCSVVAGGIFAPGRYAE